MSYSSVSQETKNKHNLFKTRYNEQDEYKHFQYRRHDNKWQGKRFDATLPTRKGVYFIRYKFCHNCFDVRRHTSGKSTEKETFQAGICASCRSLPSGSTDYYECLYHALLVSPLLGDGFEHSFKDAMLHLGYYTTYASNGGISIRNRLQEEVRANSEPALDVASNESDAESGGMETNEGNDVSSSQSSYDGSLFLYSSPEL